MSDKSVQTEKNLRDAAAQSSMWRKGGENVGTPLSSARGHLHPRLEFTQESGVLSREGEGGTGTTAGKSAEAALVML